MDAWLVFPSCQKIIDSAELIKFHNIFIVFLFFFFAFLWFFFMVNVALFWKLTRFLYVIPDPNHQLLKNEKIN
jgi:hypothetical protein